MALCMTLNKGCNSGDCSIRVLIFQRKITEEAAKCEQVKQIAMLQAKEEW